MISFFAGGLRTARGALAALVTGLCAAAASTASAEDTSFFESKIRPLLVENCYECHSADKKQHGNLLLDTREGARRGGDSGPAVIPGDVAKSLLISAVKHLDGLEMPPEKKLSEEQIADLEEWIRRGAADPRVGSSPLTKIEQHFESAKTHWSFQPIVDPRPAVLDDLIDSPASPEADRRILLRRAYLDLLGVPPTFDEVAAFVADSSPQAFETVIDRLLADPRYGERWGRHWLDVARYADNMGSIGAADDTYPFAYTYRDYVVEAFNDDKPYDRFLLEQLAADQLDSASDVRTQAAMGFLGVGRRKDRRIDDDFFDDAIDVIGRGVLGLTISCARCHDHKLEPISTKDYYALYAVLKSSKEPDLQPALPQSDTPESREFNSKNRELRGRFALGSIQAASLATAYLRSRTGDYMRNAFEAGWKSVYEDKAAKDRLDKLKLPTEPHNAWARQGRVWIESHMEVFGPFWEFAEKKQLPPTTKLNPLVARAFAAPVKDWDDLAERYNRLFTEVDTAWRTQVADEMKRPVELMDGELELDVKKLQAPCIARLDEIESKHKLSDPAAESIRQALCAPGSPMKFAPDRFSSSRLFREPDKKLFDVPGRALADLLAKHPGAPPRAMTFVDDAKIYEGKVFLRGNPQTLGPDAPRKFLTVLSDVAPDPFPADKSGRLELAQAVVNRANPLTARVIVNRVWAWHFGEPLVASPSDFGFRGERPTNQPLLDHLAAWFMDHDWSFKRLHKYLMLTRAYRSREFPVRPLEFEPFRDSLLAVSGRLQAEPRGGKPMKIQETNRRTIYGFVDRRMLPSLYRSFDFPDPSFTSPGRSRTSLTPRALILLNSPLLTDAAKSLAAIVTKAQSDDTSRIEELYRRAFQREPTESERSRAHAYLAAYPQQDLVHPEAQDWQYGFADFDATTQRTIGFKTLGGFNGASFKQNGLVLNAVGGDAGPASNQSTVRRWIAPLDGEVSLAAELIHMDEKSDGVTARVVSSRSGKLGEWQAKMSAVCTDIERISVRKGDVLDFIVTSKNGRDAGAYQWSPSIVMPGAEMPAMPGMNRRWDARVDFANPQDPPKPLTAWEELCQAVLLSPEFAVLE